MLLIVFVYFESEFIIYMFEREKLIFGLINSFDLLYSRFYVGFRLLHRLYFIFFNCVLESSQLPYITSHCQILKWIFFYLKSPPPPPGLPRAYFPYPQVLFKCPYLLSRNPKNVGGGEGGKFRKSCLQKSDIKTKT